jgi:HJR/Mrr/RecB family endonuclease
MARRYIRKYQGESDLDRFMIAILILYLFYLLFLWFTDKENFWRWVIYGLIALILLVVGVVIYNKIRIKTRKKKIERMVNIIKEVGLEKYIDGFISSYGLGNQEKNKKSWNYRDYSIAWYRIDDLNKFLKEKNVMFSNHDICLLLRNYIEEREYKKMLESSKINAYYFKDLSGVDFEKLLYRLYEKMGYVVQFTGKTGDQGGDLIIAKKEKRIVVQAKRYQNLVSNKAIQEAVAAKGIYNCNGATVVTTSNFTDSALELARANYVYLINGKKLRELLLYYLKENWS